MLRIRGTGGLAALPAVGTTTAGGGLPVRLHSCGVPVVKQTCHWHVCTCPDRCSSLRTISAPVGTFLLPALSHSALQTTAAQCLSLVRVSVAFGGQLRCPRQHRHQKITDKFLHHKNRRNKNPEAHASGVTCCLVLSPVSLLVRFYLCNFSPTCVLCFVYICCHRICVFILYASVK